MVPDYGCGSLADRHFPETDGSISRSVEVESFSPWETKDLRFSVRAVALTGAIIWGGIVLLVGIANAAWPSYGALFLQVLDSIYPGYHATGSAGSVVVGTLYAIVDGAVLGFLIAWVYNRLAGSGTGTGSGEAQ